MRTIFYRDVNARHDVDHQLSLFVAGRCKSNSNRFCVQASMIENMPYVLAEASVARIPLLTYDVGGVTEMIDPALHADIIVGTPKVHS